MIIVLFFFMLCLLLTVSLVLLRVAAKRLLQFDTLFSSLNDDIDESIERIAKLSSSGLLSTSIEALEFHHGLMELKKNLEWYSIHAVRSSIKDLRRGKIKKPNPPVVI